MELKAEQVGKRPVKRGKLQKKGGECRKGEVKVRTSLNKWWNRRTSMLTAPYTITDIDILFGISTVENVLFNLNFVLLFAKKYIHDCKMTNQNIAFLSFLVLFRQELYYEEQICIKNQCEQEFIDKWAWLYDQL